MIETGADTYVNVRRWMNDPESLYEGDLLRRPTGDTLFGLSQNAPSCILHVATHRYGHTCLA